MLTDLTFLQTGAPWPPACEKARIDQYNDNRKLFENDHASIKSGVFKSVFERVMRDINASGEPVPPVSYEVVVGYPKLISVSTAGLLFNKAPGIVAGKESDTQAMQAVQDISERSDLQTVLYTCALDVSRYGTGLLYVRTDEEGKGIVDLTRPDVWFPVVDAANLRRTLYHVLATPYTVRTAVLGMTVTKQYLRVEIHSKGSIEIRDYNLKDGQIGSQEGTPRIQQTGLTDFAVIPVHNLLPSDRVYGLDDYDDVQSLVCELEVRIAQISKVLDRHTDPTMQGPEDALTLVEREGQPPAREFVPGKFYINQSGGIQGKIEYVTWDAQLEANFKFMDKIVELIRVISQMGALLSDLSDKSGAIPSGAAMRRMLYGAISKISRIRNNFAPAIKRALRLASMLSGYSLADKPIYIDWPDTLPRDPLEMAQVAQIRTGSKQTQSVKRAIMDMDELNEEDAEAELEAIRDDQAEAMAMLEPVADDDDEEDDGGNEAGGGEGV